MSEGRHSDILSEPFASDEEDHTSSSDSDANETEAEIDRERADEAFARRQRERIFEVYRKMMADVNALRSMNSDSNRQFRDHLVDSNEIRPSESTANLDESWRNVDRALENADNANDAAKKSTKRRWIFIVVGLTIAGGLGYAIYELIRRNARNQGTHDLDVSDDVKKAVSDLVEKWSAEPDATFWTDFANAVDAGLTVGGTKQPFTIADQIVFLNLTIDTNPLKTLWQWQSAKDIEANAEGIFKFYQATGKVSDIYRHVLEVKGNNDGEIQVMPRAVAAAQLRIVLGWILGGKTSLS